MIEQSPSQQFFEELTIFLLFTGSENDYLISLFSYQWDASNFISLF